MELRKGETRRDVWRCVAIGSLLLTLFGASSTLAQQPVRWLTGGLLTKELNRPMAYHCANSPIRRTLHNLSRASRVAVVLDRRVDPTRKLQIKADDVSLLAVLDGVARTYNSMHAWKGARPRPAVEIDITQFGSVIYVGPRAVARGLRTIAERRRDDLRKLPAVQTRGLNSRSRLQWEELATPRQILQEMAKKARIEIVDLEEHIPHDLWPAADLPVMSFTDRLTLLTVQFGLTFRIDKSGKRVQLVPVSPEDLTLERSHAGGSDPEKLAEAWRKARPDAEIEVQGKKLLVRGRWEDHEWRTNPSRGGINAYTFTIRMETVETVIRGIAKQLKLELKVDEPGLRTAGIDLQKRFSLNLVQPSADKLFAELLKPHGLKHRLQGKVLEVMPAKP